MCEAMEKQKQKQEQKHKVWNFGPNRNLWNFCCSLELIQTVLKKTFALLQKLLQKLTEIQINTYSHEVSGQISGEIIKIMIIKKKSFQSNISLKNDISTREKGRDGVNVPQLFIKMLGI